MLKLENLSVHYGAIEALKNLSLEVHKGEIVSLIGANGAGENHNTSDHIRTRKKDFRKHTVPGRRSFPKYLPQPLSKKASLTFLKEDASFPK